MNGVGNGTNGANSTDKSQIGVTREVNHSLLFQVVTWVLFFGSFIIVCGGMGTKYTLTRKLALDDLLMMLATVSGILHTCH